MLDTPHITHSAAQQTTVIHLTPPRDDIEHAIRPPGALN